MFERRLDWITAYPALDKVVENVVQLLDALDLESLVLLCQEEGGERIDV